MVKRKRPAPATTKTYEWLAETLDGQGDVIDVHHADTRAELPASGPLVSIALVCGDWRGGVVKRSWAYVLDDGSLMEWFTESGMQDDRRTGKVPKRFHDELATKKKPAKKKPAKKKPAQPACDGCALPDDCSKCERFTCSRCARTVPWSEGADDDHPGWCDVCWCEVMP